MCATCIVALGRKGSNLSFAVHGARRVPHQGRQEAHQGQQAAAPKDIEDWVFKHLWRIFCCINEQIQRVLVLLNGGGCLNPEFLDLHIPGFPDSQLTRFPDFQVPEFQRGRCRRTNSQIPMSLRQCDPSGCYFASRSWPA